MDWLDQHSDDPEEVPETTGGAIGSSSAGTETANPEAEAEAEAKSLRCDECGKLFRSSDLAQFHATKTGHANFSQSSEEVKPQ